MGLQWEILSPFCALVITAGAMCVAVFLTGALRRHDYRRFEEKSAPKLALQFPLPDVEPSIAEQRRSFLSTFVEVRHKVASTAQTKYYNAVVCSAGCLVLAFTAWRLAL
jgi:hypothetical protein